jgi:sodium-coupled neutral amino acid transporter 11
MPSATTVDYKNMDFEYDNKNGDKSSANNSNDSEYVEHKSPTNGNGNCAAQTAAASKPALSMPKKKSSILGASSNLVNSIVGAGIIGIPYAIRMTGLISGLLLLILVAVLTDKSLRLLIEQASFHPKLKNRNVHTFEDLASYPFGQFGSGFVLFNMFIMAYGAMVAYLLIIKDTIPTVLGYEHGTHLLERNLIVIATSLAVMVPLSMQRDMASLSLTSALSVTADIILVVFIASFAPVKESVAEEGGFLKVLRQDGVQATLFIGLGILSTAMACQHSAFIVANSLENKTRRRWKIVTNQSITIAAILCAILGVCGYLGFLGKTQGDVLNNFPLDSIQANAARILLAFTMYVTYPMESFVARHVLIMLVHNGDMDARGGFTLENESQVEEIELAEKRPEHHNDDGTVNTTNTNYTAIVVEGGGIFCMNRRQSWTLTVYLTSLIPALIFSDIGPVLSLTGAVGGSCICYMGPGFVYLGVNGDEFLSKVADWVEHWRRAKGYSKSDKSGVTESSDLPVDGDASLELPQNPTNIDSYDRLHAGPKPFWYYIGLFPLWCSVANKGATHTKQKIEASHLPNVAEDDSDVLPAPTNWDFFIALFFVFFGAISMVAGVVSNVYVQWHNLDEVEL